MPSANYLTNYFKARLDKQVFNAKNMHHLAAYVCLRDLGRQHPTMRFVLEEPHISIPVMMEAKIADEYIKQFDSVITEAQHVCSALVQPS